MVPEQVQRMIDDPAVPFRRNPVDDIGRVEDDPDWPAGKIGDQTRRPVCVPDNVGRLRLDTDQNAVLRRVLADALELTAHLGPALRVVIGRVMLPLVLRMLAAAADRDKIAADGACLFANCQKRPASRGKAVRVGVCHVVGRGNGGYAGARFQHGVAHLVGYVVRNRFGKRADSGT